VVTLGPHYHVGIVVADLRAARARFSERLGLTWGPIVHMDRVEYRAADGSDVLLPTTICYSTAQPCLELIEEVPGTVWARNEHSNLHHIGFWTDDLTADSAALTEIGCPLQLAGRAGPVAPATFAYHRDDEIGVRIELVDAAMRDAMAPLFAPDPT
jgi:catechol 2,3-dioxygenase-like lactoylglutathione lyase family enzyme